MGTPLWSLGAKAVSELLEGESTSTSLEPEWTSPWGSPAVSTSTPQNPSTKENSDGASKVMAQTSTLLPESKLQVISDCPKTPPIPPPNKASSPSPSRFSPPRRPPAPSFPNDDIHCALLELADEFPIVQTFQRINVGFYKVDGMGTCELSLSRTGEKLLAKLDGWNRGVRGELLKFLQSMMPEQGSYKLIARISIHISLQTLTKLDEVFFLE